jgi:hypothetical protein
MAYEFSKVDILIFDYHPAIGALESFEQIHSEFRFLVDPLEYATRYKSSEPIQKQHFKIHPMKWRMLAHNHFWKHYQTVGESSAAPDFWKLQMPFVCHPLQSKIELDTNNPNFKGRVRTFAYLSGIGWSTNLEIRLLGMIKPSQLRDFVHKLFLAPVFTVDGVAKTLKDTFVNFADHMMQDIYMPQLVAPPRIKRHFVISLSEFTGDISHYRSQGLGLKQMPASDRAMMHSILMGQTISVPEVIQLEKTNSFARTEYLGADFALTYFDHGTLVFLQRAALKGSKLWKKKKRHAIRCHAANIRNYSLMTLVQYRFYAETAKYAGKKDKIDLLRESIKKNLIDLPSKYDNPLSEAFHERYNPTKIRR